MYKESEKMQNEFHNLILFGPPGSGKGTLCEILKKKYNYQIISTGNILRIMAKENTPFSVNIKNIMSKGNLLPDQIVSTIITNKIEACNKLKLAYILDGYPQNINQYNYLKDWLVSSKKYCQPIFITLNIEDEKAIERMSTRLSCTNCQKIYNERLAPPLISNVCDLCNFILEKRAADNVSSAKHRLNVFKEHTLPILHYIKKDFPYVSFDKPSITDFEVL